MSESHHPNAHIISQQNIALSEGVRQHISFMANTLRTYLNNGRGPHPEARSGEIFVGWIPEPSLKQVQWNTARFGSPRSEARHPEYPLFVETPEWNAGPGSRR